MIPRYSRPEMAAIWTEHAKLQRWLDVELAVCRAWARRGVIPADDLHEIETKAAFSVERTLEIEKTTNHDVVAFLTNVNENIGPASRWVRSSTRMLSSGPPDFPFVFSTLAPQSAPSLFPCETGSRCRPSRRSAIIICWISDVPSKILVSRASRQ